MSETGGAADQPQPGRLRQMEIYVTGAGGARPLVPVSPKALEEKAGRA